MSIITLLTNVLPVPDFTTFLGVMIGLGVGIDYALLIVTRYREQLHAGHDPRESIGIAIDTAGRSVLFAGTTVVISLMGLLLMGVKFVQGLSVGAAAVVAVDRRRVAHAAPGVARVRRRPHRAHTLAGPRRGRCSIALGLVGVGLHVPALSVAFLVAIVVLIAGFFVSVLKREVPRRPTKPRRQTTAYRWSRVIQRHPWTAAILERARADPPRHPGPQPASRASRTRATSPGHHDAARPTTCSSTGFGPGFNGPLLLVAEVPDGTDVEQLSTAVTEAVSADPGVAFVSPGQPNDPNDPTAVVWNVVPTTGPQDESTTELVHRLRDDVLPPIERQTGVDVLVTGSVAVNVDFSDLPRRPHAVLLRRGAHPVVPAA